MKKDAIIFAIGLGLLLLLAYVVTNQKLIVLTPRPNPIVIPVPYSPNPIIVPRQPELHIYPVVPDHYLPRTNCDE